MKIPLLTAYCRLTFLLCALFFAAVSCKGKATLPLPSSQNDEQTEEDIPASFADHKWYCFVDKDIREAELPRRSSPQGRKPWTEAVRVSSMCSAEGDGTGVATAYALVNRLGMITMDGGEIQLHQDASVFDSCTAGQMAFSEDVPIFNVYRNALFNDLAGKTQAVHHFLVQFDPATSIFYPIISCGNLGLGDNSEVVDYVWNGEDFLCSIKTITEVNDNLGAATGAKLRTQFSYITVTTSKPLTSITPQDGGAVHTAPSTKEEFRGARMTMPFSAAPKRLRSLMGFLEGEVSFIVTCCTVGGHSPRGFVSESGGALLNAYAILGDTYACAMFGDGTTYLTGSVGVPLPNGITAFRLPKLPAGWAYTSFAISGTYLYAAWEETDFYRTGRAGLLLVDLSRALK